MNNDFWNNIIGNTTNEHILLKAFFTHADESLLEMEDRAAILLKTLQKYSCKDCLNIISDGFVPNKIDGATEVRRVGVP